MPASHGKSTLGAAARPKAGRYSRSRILVLLTAAAVTQLLVLAEARAATPAFVAVGRMSVPVFSRLGAASATPAQQAQEPEQRRPPPFADPSNGVVFSILGGSVFSGASAFQTGAAFAYFFGDKAAFGFEAEGDITFGPGGRVIQGMGSFVIQTGARTSKFVPYFAVGGGYLRANSRLPTATEAVLNDFGIDPQPKTSQSPFFQFGGGVRFYVKPNVAFRGDVRFAQVLLGVKELGFWDRIFAMRRVAGMVSWDF